MVIAMLVKQHGQRILPTGEMYLENSQASQSLAGSSEDSPIDLSQDVSALCMLKYNIKTNVFIVQVSLYRKILVMPVCYYIHRIFVTELYFSVSRFSITYLICRLSCVTSRTDCSLYIEMISYLRFVDWHLLTTGTANYYRRASRPSPSVDGWIE